MNKLFILFSFLVLASCSKPDVHYRSEELSDFQSDDSNPIDYTLYLIGDAGGDTAQSKKVLSLMKTDRRRSLSEKTGLVFLGDNIYPEGLHSEGHELRDQDLSRIDAQINAVKDFQGDLVFIPGNHDWKKGKEEGLDFVQRQEKYVQEQLDRKVFHPSDGCFGPKEIELTANFTLIVIDTQWWLHQYEKSRGIEDDCEFRTEAAFVAEFKELLKTNREKNVLVVGHHPLYSNGFHGGYFTWRDHLFPLSRKYPKLWIPLPIIGSIYPYYRSFFGNIQDLPNPKYQALKENLLAAMEEYENVMYAAGHEHNLQYKYEEELHHIVSGSGSKMTPLRFNQQLDFGSEHLGFAKILVHKDGQVVLQFHDATKPQKSMIFDRVLYQKKARKFDLSKRKQHTYKDSVAIVVPDSLMAANSFKRMFFGDLNRDLWTLPLEVPYLDLHEAYGGLTPYGKGGGQQTISLKLKGGDGYVYKLRGIKKSADFLVSRELRGTLAQDAIYDGIAGSHPYASMAVPKMAKAANLYYTEPRLVYVPKDSILGDYLNEFGGMFCLFEIHPNDDMSAFENFGNSPKVINYQKAIEKLEKDSEYRVDVEFAVRARLFDILLGDWDRHDDQWRWATFEQEDHTLIRPIPRDRDQVFFKFDGAVMNIANRKWLLRKFQNFENEIRDIAGLGFNARYFDRYFLNEANRDIWINQAKELQALIRQEDLQKALQELPKPAFDYNGEELIEILEARKGNLVDFAKEYYHFLAKEVDVRGTLEKDYFEVIRMENGNVEVNVYPRKKGKKQKKKRFYHRIFSPKETKEIRLYGLDGKDEYEIKGESKSSILVRIIGGESKDKVRDGSKVKGIGKHTIVYETEGKGDYDLGQEAKLKVKPVEDAYFYDRKEFKYDVLFPIPSLGFNPDDGFYLGPGFRYLKQGFKKTPYKMAHDFAANYAFRAEGFNVKYRLELMEIRDQVDLELSTQVNHPEVFQFYGFGNETAPGTKRIGNSDVRLNQYELMSSFVLSSKERKSRLRLNLGYQWIALREFPKILGAVEEAERDAFLQTGLQYDYLNTDNAVHPKRGIHYFAALQSTQGTETDEVSFVELETSLSFYIPINYFKNQTTLALRSGVSTLLGDYNFYQANFLSGLEHFRGIPRNRFAGETISYNNIELRRSFYEVQNYLAPFDWGMLAHYDLGRVWAEGESSNLWHQSFGFGMYFSILDFVSLVGTYSISDVDEVVNVGTKFYF